jgi:hypothetical protein
MEFHMSKFLAAAGAILIVTASAAPGVAASNTVAQVGDVPRCESDAGMSVRAQLAAELRLDTKLNPTIDVWNGCLKVNYTDSTGHNVTTFYDPDTLNPINGPN